MPNVREWLVFKAKGAIGARLITAFDNAAGDSGAATGEALVANGAAAAVFGVSGTRAVADGETVEVAAPGSVAQVVYGGTVDAGDFLTANATGKAVATTTAGARIIGIAAADGVANDIGEVLISPGSV
ncbi:MAG: hypothetical protein OXF74_02675 [Rhodobacteraceae bacterium]|nr:hypothetical protein [Paracoccaceae bacterium]